MLFVLGCKDCKEYDLFSYVKGKERRKNEGKINVNEEVTLEEAHFTRIRVNLIFRRIKPQRFSAGCRASKR